MPVLTTLQQVQALMSADQDAYATAVPSTGEKVSALHDGCYLQNGFSKKVLTEFVDADVADYARPSSYQIGQQYSNIALTAERTLNNADGSTRTEADYTYDVVYKDGSRQSRSQTAVTGSTSGLCATPST